MGVISRFWDKNQRLKKRGFFQFLAVFGPNFGPNFQKNIFFVMTDHKFRPKNSWIFKILSIKKQAQTHPGHGYKIDLDQIFMPYLLSYAVGSVIVAFV